MRSGETFEEARKRQARLGRTLDITAAQYEVLEETAERKPERYASSLYLGEISTRWIRDVTLETLMARGFIERRPAIDVDQFEQIRLDQTARATVALAESDWHAALVALREIEAALDLREKVRWFITDAGLEAVRQAERTLTGE